jgi:hypothetical protein
MMEECSPIVVEIFPKPIMKLGIDSMHAIDRGIEEYLDQVVDEIFS